MQNEKHKCEDEESNLGALRTGMQLQSLPVIYVLCPIVYIVGCLCKLIIAASHARACAKAYVHAYEENPVT